MYIEVEPNNSIAQAQPIPLADGDADQTIHITGAADDIEYFDNGLVDRSGDDWFRLEFKGTKPRLFTANLIVTGPLVVARLRFSTANSKEYKEGMNANERVRNRGEIFEDDIQTTHRQIHNNLLTSAGIDPTIEPWMSLIELAIKDDDPTRVLIGCEQKIVLKSRLRDPMLDRLGLERANPKLIRCNLHKHKVVGRELDATGEEFNRRFCNACPDKVPRDPNWTFYEEDT